MARKVNICRPALLNETILATRREFLFTKVVPVQRITGIIGSLINGALLNVYFMLH